MIDNDVFIAQAFTGNRDVESGIRIIFLFTAQPAHKDFKFYKGKDSSRNHGSGSRGLSPYK